MPTFLYKAKDVNGKMLEGMLEADTRLLAVDKLSQKGCFPVSVEEKSQGTGENKSFFSFWKRVSANDLSVFTRQLSDLLESNVPLLRALKVAGEQAEKKELRRIVQEVRTRIESGLSFSQSLEPYADIFSSVYRSLVHAGEVSGMLAVTLNRLADFTEQEDELRSKIRSAMIYPSFIALVGIAIVMFMMTFVVPRLTDLFSDMGQHLPWITQALVSCSGFVSQYFFLLLVLFAGVLVLIKTGNRAEKLQSFFSRLFLRMPVWGQLIKKTAVARFAKTLSALLSGGVPMLEALKVVSDVLGHSLLKDQVLQAAQSVKHGAGLAESLKSMPDFPDFICNMIAVGEEANILEKSLQKVAGHYERESDRAFKMMTSFIEPAMILLIGSVILFIVIALLLPIFQISTLVN